MSNQKIIERVKNLLALHKNNTSVNEASAAYKAAQRLLTEHRLTMADVEEAQGFVEEIREFENKPLYSGRSKITWKSRLAHAIAKSNGCDVLLYGGDIRVIGRESDFIIVEWLFNSVCAQIEQLAKTNCQGKGKGYSNDFKLGAVSQVSRRLNEAKDLTHTQYAGTKALTLVNQKDEAVEAFVKYVLKPKTIKLADAKQHDAYYKGVAEGNKVALAKAGLKEKKEKKPINLLY